MPTQGSNIINYNLEDKEYKLLVADEQKEYSAGLMFIEKPVLFDGMLFSFPDKSKRTFWNKNTYVDLKVYWLVDNEVVGVSDLPSIKKSKDLVIISSPVAVDGVVEIIQ